MPDRTTACPKHTEEHSNTCPECSAIRLAESGRICNDHPYEHSNTCPKCFDIRMAPDA